MGIFDGFSTVESEGVPGFCPTVVARFYMCHATRSLSKWIKLSYCDSYDYELHVFPCSKITKIYLVLICQCSIGPPFKHPQFVASFTASSWTEAQSLVRAGAYQKAGTNKNSTSIGGEFIYFAQNGSPQHFCCTGRSGPCDSYPKKPPTKWWEIERNHPKKSVQLYVYMDVLYTCIPKIANKEKNSQGPFYKYSISFYHFYRVHISDYSDRTASEPLLLNKKQNNKL